MADFSGRPAQSSDDCWASNQNTPSKTLTGILSVPGQGVASQGIAALRIPSVTIGQGVTVESAYLSLKAVGSYTGPATLQTQVYGHAADNAATFTSNETLSQRTHTIATVLWDNHITVDGVVYQIDVTDIVNEILARSGWASGNAIAFLLIAATGCPEAEWNEYESFDTDAAAAPLLEITLATGGSDQTVDLSVAQLAATEPQSSVQPGAVSKALGVAAAGLTGPQAIVAATPPPQTVNIATSTLQLTSPPLEVLPGTANNVVAPALLALAGPPLTVLNASASHNVEIGELYFDASPKQIVRDSGGTVYIIAPNCDSYPDFTATGLDQTIRVFKGNSTSPTSFVRQDSSNEPAAVVGCAAAIDGDDVIHIAWCARSSISNVRYLRYAPFAGDTWGSVVTIASDLDYDDIGQGDENAAVVIDAAGNVHIVYLSASSGTRRVYYTNNIGSVWAAPALIDGAVSYTGNQKAWHPSIAFDADGRIVAGWMRGTFNGVNDATTYINVYSGAWGGAVQVDTGTATDIDTNVSLLVTPDNRYHLAVLGAKTDNWGPIRYWYSDNNGASWTANHPSVSRTHNVTLGPGDLGDIRIYYHGDGSPVNIYYVEGAGGPADWDSPVEYVVGYYDCSIGSRWSQYHMHHPEYADVVYWNEVYPNVGYYGFDQVLTNQVVDLLPAILLAASSQMSVQAGAVSLALSLAQLLTMGLQADAQPGTVEIALALGLLATNGLQVSVQPGAVSKSLGLAQLLASGPQTSISAPAGLFINLAAALLQASGPRSDVQPGAVSRDMATALISLAGHQVTVGALIPPTTISLLAAQLAANGQQGSVQPGAVSVALALALAGTTGARITLGEFAIIGLVSAIWSTSQPQQVVWESAQSQNVIWKSAQPRIEFKD